MTISLDGTMVFKEENIDPLTYPDMTVKYKGVYGSYDFADAKIRKLWIKSFDF